MEVQVKVVGVQRIQLALIQLAKAVTPPLALAPLQGLQATFLPAVISAHACLQTSKDASVLTRWNCGRCCEARGDTPHSREWYLTPRRSLKSTATTGTRRKGHML